MPEHITLLLNYLLGSTTLVSIYIAYKFTEQTDRKFEEMQTLINKQAEEIKNLKSQIADYEKRCKHCQK